MRLTDREPPISPCSSKEAGSTNPRGIPVAPFVDKVEDFVPSREDVEGTLRNFQELISCVHRPARAPPGDDDDTP